jgi:hypothetical protein
LVDDPTFGALLVPGLVLPGEEEEARLRPVQERVLTLWRTAHAVIVIGYRFGLNSGLRYDQIWLDTFIETQGQRFGSGAHSGSRCERSPQPPGRFSQAGRQRVRVAVSLERSCQ